MEGGDSGLRSCPATLARRDDYLTVQPQGCAELTALAVSSQELTRFSSLCLDGLVCRNDLCRLMLVSSSRAKVRADS